MKPAYLLAAVTLAAVLCSQTAPPERVGPLPNGGFLLNSGWRLSPAGTQVGLDTFPMSTALSPDGRFLLILHGGYRQPTIAVYDVQANREIGRVSAPDLWLGSPSRPTAARSTPAEDRKATCMSFHFLRLAR